MKGVSVDINSISNMAVGGRRILAAEVLQIYKDTGVLVYDSEQGNAPMIIEGDIKLIDWQTDEGKEYLKQFAK